MARKRLFTAGRFWLDFRPDGKSPFYQIRWYDDAAKTTRGKSTGCTSLADAKKAILAHAEADLAEGPQDVFEALAVAVLLKYWEEHGVNRRNSAATENSLRTFVAFMEQDRIGIDATVDQLKPDVFRRFREWRMKPHGWDLEWRGGRHTWQSRGVTGETVQRNLDDVRAALNYAVEMGRLPYAPKVHSVPTELRSPPRDVRMTLKELGALVGYAAYDLAALRWILGMIATGCRPDATLNWRPPKQWDGGELFDTHPHGWPRTKKRNAVVPVIEGFRPWLAAWAAYPHPIVKSRKTWWRTMRAALGFPAEYVPKVIRHTIATELRARGVPLDDIAGLLGHTSDRRVTQVYAKYDPTRLSHAKQVLEDIWREICAYAKEWLTDHKRTKAAYGQPIAIERTMELC